MNNYLLLGKKITANSEKPRESVMRFRKHNRDMLDYALALDSMEYLRSQYTHLSNCTKVKVACSLYDYHLEYASYGVNYVKGITSCEEEFCKKDNSMTPKHRHTDCQAVHSEIMALQNWFKTLDKQPYYAFVTRYPCEACLKKLALFGVKICYYSGKAFPNGLEDTYLREFGVMCIHVKEKRPH